MVLAFSAVAPLPQQRSRQGFEARVETAVFEVRVTDEGRSVRGLQAVDFAVTEDGQPRPITYFLESDASTVRAGLLVDTGSSMSEREIIRAKRLIFELMYELSPEDEIRIVTFDRRPHFLSEWTSDRTQLLRALDDLHPGGRPSRLSLFGRSVAGGVGAVQLDFSASNSATGLAVDETLWGMRDAPPPKVLVVLSSGFGGLGAATIDHLRDAGARFFAVSVDHRIGSILSFGGAAAIRDRAVANTGGVGFEADRILEQVQQLRNAIKHYYWIGFEPAAGPDADVRISLPSAPDLHPSFAPALTKAGRRQPGR